MKDKVLQLSEEDIVAAMKSLHGYIDVTPGDFKEIYLLALKHAVERLSRSLTARDVMTRDVHTVFADAPLSEAAALMAERGVSGLPVVDAERKVLGVISEKDFLSGLAEGRARSFMGLLSACLESAQCVSAELSRLRAGDLMSRPPVCIRESTPVAEIGALFSERNINRAPVTDEDGRLRGIVSRGDILSAMDRVFACQFPEREP